MYRVLKQIAAFGLGLLIALPLIFTIGILVKQKIIQLHRCERFEKEMLRTIVLPADKIHWIKAGKEILIDGKLFDIKHSEKKSNQVILTGFFDKEEDSLYDQMNRMAKDRNKPSPFASVVNFFLTPFFNQHLSTSFPVNWQLFSKKYISYTEKIPPHPISDITRPPVP